MQAKHLEVLPPVVPVDPPETTPITVNSEEVQEAIKSFRHGSAPGPFGLRGEYLKEGGGAWEWEGCCSPGCPHQAQQRSGRGIAAS